MDPKEKKNAPEEKTLQEQLTEALKEVKEGNKTIEELKGFSEKFEKEIESLKAGTEDVKETAKQINELKKTNDNLQDMLGRVDAIEIALKRVGGQGAPDEGAGNAERKQYDSKFREFLVKGDSVENALGDMEKKLLSTNNDEDGGYLVSSEIEAEVTRVANETVSMRGLCFVKTLSGKKRSWKKRINKGGAAARWEGENEQDTTNTNTQQYARLEIVLGKLVAKPMITQEAEEDGEGIEQDLASELSIAFANSEAAAFVNGSGVNRPKGFLTETMVANASWTWGNIGYVVTGVSGGFKALDASNEASPADNIIDLITAVPNQYLPGSVFIANKTTIATLRKFKDADANFIWQDSTRKGMPPTLFGYDVIEVSDMPDIGANSYSVAFGNFRMGYAIVDRAGMRTIRDPYSKKPDVEYCTTKRVGGNVMMYDAIKVLKFGTS